MLSRRWLNALLIAAALASNSCLTLMGGEEAMGAQAARQVEAEIGLVDDPALEAYVREIGKRLVANATRQDVTWRFQIVDTSAPNAFALPGGWIYVSRGLLALVNDEAELAGVIGHEIGHVTAGHGNKRATLSAPFMILSGITGWATGIVSPRLGEVVAGAGDTMAQGLVIAPFSRGQEREADRIGAELAAGAGWDPQALGDFLESLGRFEKLATGKERRASWLDSHPPSPERAAASREFASKLERAAASPVARDQTELFQRLDGLLLGEDAAAGVAVDDRFVHPELGWSIRFPEGWSLMNTPGAVASAEPGGRAVIVLQLAAANKTLDALLAEIEEEGASELAIERKTVNGRAAAHTAIVQKGNRIDVTWLEHGAHVYQIAGVCPRRDQATWQSSFDQVIQSLRDVRASEIQRIREHRLRIATADGHESLAQLLVRVGSSWDAPTAAVANAIETDSRLAAGRLVKFGREEPYTPRD